MPKQARPVKRVIAFTAEEHVDLRRRALVVGWPFARYVRETALGVLPVMPPGRVETGLVQELTRIGNNLNQLAREANAARAFSSEAKIEAVLAAVLAAAERV